MSRRPCILIGAVLAVEYDKAKFGEAARAETIATALEETVRKTIGVKVVRFEAKHSSIAE